MNLLIRPIVAWLALCMCLLLLAGCASALPKSNQDMTSGFKDFKDVKKNFDAVVPGTTKVTELKKLGFDPKTTPNVRRLSYPDLLSVFLPNPSIRIQDQAPAVRHCFEEREHCYGIQMNPSFQHSKRIGNAFLDVFGFKRTTHVTGWSFKAMFVVLDDTVVYKLWSGEPSIDTTSQVKNPLGPLQSLTIPGPSLQW